MKSEEVDLINKCGCLSAYRKVGTDVFRACDGADAMVLMTAHREFRELDLRRVKECMRTPIVIDGRRVNEQGAVRRLGFVSAFEFGVKGRGGLGDL